jgi:hypothetical protein
MPARGVQELNNGGFHKAVWVFSLIWARRHVYAFAEYDQGWSIGNHDTLEKRKSRISVPLYTLPYLYRSHDFLFLCVLLFVLDLPINCECFKALSHIWQFWIISYMQVSNRRSCGACGISST